MEQDISRSAVIILVILTLAVSVIGTFAVLDQLNAVSQPPSSSHGNVRLTIIDHGRHPAAPAPSSSGGEVALTILEPR